MRNQPRVLVAALAVAAAAAAKPAFAQSVVTAQGVSLNAGANCTDNADLDITFTSGNVDREFGQASTVAADILPSSVFEQGSGLDGFSGTFVGYGIPFSESQAPGTLIGTYAYLGDTPPNAATTGEFFILYNCSTQEVVLSCFGAFGTCPQTARQALQAPAVPSWALPATGLALLLIGGFFLRFRAAGRPV